ncbi:MAG: universal stress protein [Actinobacteria bacterium]|nr:universal stress protein [Actinomycetota bacterium]
MNRTNVRPALRPETDRCTTSLAGIVVGVDGTYAAGEALGWAARIACTTGVTLTAVYAWQPGLGDSTSGHERAVAQRRHELHQWCQPASDTGVEARPVVRDGELFSVLAYTVRAGGETHGRHLVVLGRAAPGSGIPRDFDHQVDSVARHLRVPLAVVPSPGAGRQLARVVLGAVGSASAHAAATWLANVRLDLEIHVVTTLEPIVEWVPRSSPTSVWSRVRDELEGPWTAPLRRAGVDYSTHLIEGINVTNALTDYARQCHADAIIVGLGDNTANRRRHSGTDLLDRCHLPVILVPVDDPATAEERR